MKIYKWRLFSRKNDEYLGKRNMCHMGRLHFTLNTRVFSLFLIVFIISCLSFFSKGLEDYWNMLSTQ